MGFLPNGKSRIKSCDMKMNRKNAGSSLFYIGDFIRRPGFVLVVDAFSSSIQLFTSTNKLRKLFHGPSNTFCRAGEIYRPVILSEKWSTYSHYFSLIIALPDTTNTCSVHRVTGTPKWTNTTTSAYPVSFPIASRLQVLRWLSSLTEWNVSILATISLVYMGI